VQNLLGTTGSESRSETDAPPALKLRRSS
jgi:hypothetical protein